jgi:putative restriction endonuclease
MDRSEALRLFHDITVWSRGDQRAPNKPLLILYALGCWSHGIVLLSYSDVHTDLSKLLNEFGPPRRTPHPEQPFWRLQNDGVWVVSGVSQPLNSDRFPHIADLQRQGVKGQFAPVLQELMRTDPSIVGDIARHLLASHFPESLHQEILSAVDLSIDDDVGVAGGRRDPGFRRQVLTAYEYQCAVCGFQLLLTGIPVALDAAHIKWHQASGPAVVQNGICLCVLHHKTFDLGVFTVGSDSVVTVSEEASGICGFQEAILSFHGKTLRSPIQQEARPAAEFIDWHWREVFRGKPRPFGTSGR